MKNPYNFPPEILEANRKVRKRNYKIIALALGGLVIGITAFIFLITFILESSDAFKLSEHEIRKNAEILKATGGIVEVSCSTGSVSTHNDGGEANFDIDVKGRKNDVDVSVYLTKYNDDWRIDEISWE